MHHRTAGFVALLLAGSTAGVSAAKSQTPVISVGMHYQQAHDRMTMAGFRAFRVLAPDDPLYKRHFPAREDIPRKYPEAAGCASTGRSPCHFLFTRDADEIVAVTTFGGPVDGLIVRHARAVTLKEANALYDK